MAGQVTSRKNLRAARRISGLAVQSLQRRTEVFFSAVSVRSVVILFFVPCEEVDGLCSSVDRGSEPSVP
jgi:hypothetical protein